VGGASSFTRKVCGADLFTLGATLSPSSSATIENRTVPEIPLGENTNAPASMAGAPPSRDAAESATTV